MIHSQSPSTHTRYKLEILSTKRVAGLLVTRVKTTDAYQGKKYVVERHLVAVFTNFLQWFLRRHPDMPFESRRNITRYLTYLPSGMRAWRSYMPGGFATYHVHTPHAIRMSNGSKLDMITRAFFRQTYDAVGLRSRAYIMAWLASRHVADGSSEIRWLSIGGGSGQPVYDAIASMSHKNRQRVKLTISDMNGDILEFARRMYAEQVDQPGRGAEFRRVDISDSEARARLLEDARPTVIDAMGLFEYLDDQMCEALLRDTYGLLAPRGVIIFTNMSPKHPQLDVHQRALGWPGVIQRSVRDVAALIAHAGIPEEVQSVYRAQDGVYNVYRIVK